jgi:hypothetical protein
MLNEKDIYNHLKNGGDISSLYEALENEIEAAKAKVDEEKIAEQEAAKRDAGIKEAREAAVAALTEYFALVNPSINEKIITSVLSSLESVKITVKPEKGIRSKTSIFDNWADIMSLILR